MASRPARQGLTSPGAAARRWLPLPALAALALGGCASSASPPMVPLDVPLGVAAGGDTFFLCTKDHVELRNETSVSETLNVPAAAGDPSTMAFDVADGWAAVAYRTRLALIQLLDHRVVWSPAVLSDPPLAVSIAANRVAVVGRDSVSLFRLPDGALEQTHELVEWRKQFGFDQVRYVLPLADQKLLLVGFKNMTFAGASSVIFQRIDTSKGQWQPELTSKDEGITFIHSCTSDGHFVFLAGTQEYCRAPPSGMKTAWGDLLLTLVVKRLDPATMVSNEVVWDEQHSRKVSVRELAVGSDLLAIVFDDGTLRVYRLLAEGRAGAPIFTGTFEPGITASWMSDHDMLVTNRDGASKIVQIQ